MVMEQENQAIFKLHQGQGTRQSGGSRQQKIPKPCQSQPPSGMSQSSEKQRTGECKVLLRHSGGCLGTGNPGSSFQAV